MHPSTGITKEYSVTLSRKPTMRELEKMAEGCMVRLKLHQPVMFSCCPLLAAKKQLA